MVNLRIITGIMIALPCCLAQDYPQNGDFRFTAQDLPVRSAANSVTIGNTELPLGMSKSDALTKLMSQYEVTKAKGEAVAEWDYWDIATSHDTPEDIGSVQFSHDKLVSVSRDLNQFAGLDGARALGNLFRGLRSLQRPGHTFFLMRVGTREFTAPPGRDGRESRVREIYLDTGDDRRFTIVIEESISSDTLPTVYVNESLLGPRDSQSKAPKSGTPRVVPK